MAALFGSTMAMVSVLEAEPSSPVAVKVTSYSPPSAKVWVGLVSVLVLPSPKSHAWEVALTE